MRLRTAVASVGLATIAVGALAVPAQATNWTEVGGYKTQSLCIDAGQQYEREGWNEYWCKDLGSGSNPRWELLIR
jgi:hypothetical protein